MPWLGHRQRSLLIFPQHPIQTSGPRGIGTGEIHPRGNLGAGRVVPVGLVDQAVLLVAVVRLIWQLIAGPLEQSRHHRGVGVILIHRREAEEHFHRMNQVYGGVEAMLDVGLSGLIPENIC